MHKKLLTVIGIFCMAACIQTGCSSAQKGGDVPTYYEKDNNTTIQAASGKVFKVFLPTQPSTGFDWTAASLSGVEQVGSVEYIINSPAGIVGGVETAILTFKADKAGKGKIVLHYKRSWEKNVVPAKTYTLTIEIK